MNHAISRLARVTLLGLATATLAGAVSAQAYEPRHERWHERHWDHRDAYWSAPPVVYAPPAYYGYGRPGVSLNLNFPIR